MSVEIVIKIEDKGNVENFSCVYIKGIDGTTTKIAELNSINKDHRSLIKTIKSHINKLK